MGEYNRRIQIVGNRSFAVSLPKKWVIDNNLHKTKNVVIQELQNNLILSTNNYKKKDLVQEINVEKTNLVPSMILLCYVKGVSELTLKFPDKYAYLDSKTQINKILSYLDGFKITDEIENKIIISSLYNKSDIKLNKLAKRTTAILSQMVDCLVNNQIETKNILEKEMDSLYHLSKRTLYFCSIDTQTKEDNNVFDLEEIFLLRLIFKRLENIADIMERITKKDKTKLSELKIIIKYLENIFIFNKKITYEKIDELSNKQFRCDDSKKIQNLTLDILNNFLLIELNKQIFQ